MEITELFTFERSTTQGKDCTTTTKVCDTTDFSDGPETIDAVISRFLGFLIDIGFEESDIANGFVAHIKSNVHAEDYSLQSAIENIVNNDSHFKTFIENQKDPLFLKSLFRLYVENNKELYLKAIDIQEQ
jgi:hypothetical protein